MSEILMLIVLVVLFAWGTYTDAQFTKKVDRAKSICMKVTEREHK